jgi:type IV secretion system protein VirB6
MALLSVVASMVLDLTIAVNEAIRGAKIANKLLGTDAESLSTLALQQGGIGLLLTTLIISLPPMAAMFFQGTLGGFSPYAPTDRVRENNDFSVRTPSNAYAPQGDVTKSQ